MNLPSGDSVKDPFHYELLQKYHVTSMCSTNHSSFPQFQVLLFTVPSPVHSYISNCALLHQYMRPRLVQCCHPSLGAVHKVAYVTLFFDHYGPPPPPRHALSHTDGILNVCIVTLTETPPPPPPLPLARDVLYGRPLMRHENSKRSTEGSGRTAHKKVFKKKYMNSSQDINSQEQDEAV